MLKALNKPLNNVIELVVDDALLAERICGRLVHPQTVDLIIKSSSKVSYIFFIG
jgi:adenylate kinase family enzyme